MGPSFIGDESGSSLTQAALDTLPLNIAILDTDGEILGTNKAWQEFAIANTNTMHPDTVGVNYLDICDQADDPTAAEAAEGIRDVIAGNQPVFVLEYPCHSPDEHRWFILRATRFTHNGTRYISVAHIDITDRKQAELEAERTAKKLADEREMLTLLNQIVRHDIRNDANAIAGWASLLKESLGSQGQAELQRIEATATQMMELTTTAADLTQTLTHDTADELRPTNVTESLRFQLDKLQGAPSVHSKQVELDTSRVPEVDVWVLADDMLSAVFSNLLNNAVFHTQTDPVEITVVVDQDATEETVEIRIADNGPGIPDSAKETVFGRGEKGLASDGTGLGLYLVDQLMDRYNGDVHISNNTPMGTIVHLSFQQVNPTTAEQRELDDTETQ